MVYDQPDSVQAPFFFSAGLRGNDVMDNNVVVQSDTASLENVTSSFVYKEPSFVSISTPSMIKKGLTYHWELQATDVNEEITNEYHAIPTPASSVVTFTGISGPTNIRVINALGAVVMQTNLDVNTTRINVSSLANGRYSVLLTSLADTRVVPILIHR